jgi:hypothetical protein
LRDSTGALWRALGSADPVVVVLYPHAAAREDLIELAKMLARDRGPHLAETVEDACDPTHSGQVVLLSAGDEAAAVRELAARRDELAERTAPIVLFLLSGGTGVAALGEAPGLASWVRGRLIDVDELDRFDAGLETKEFTDATGMSPEEWLRQWRAGKIPNDACARLRANEALALTKTVSDDSSD